MSDTKVATSPGAKAAFPPSKLCGNSGGPGNRRFRSCSMSGNSTIAGVHVTASTEHHRRYSQIHGPSNLIQQQQQQQKHHNRGGGGSGGGGNSCAGIKRRAGSFGGAGEFKRRKKEPGIVPVTKFLLGGNINDPLNLNSFEDDEEANRAINQVTPYNSPLPRPDLQQRVAVLIPPDICDPLNLNGGEGDIELNLVSPNFFKKKRKKKQKRTSSGGDVSEPTVAPDTAGPESGEAGRATGEPRPTTLQVPAPALPQHQRSKKVDDKIVSPVIPQPGSRKRRPSSLRQAIQRDDNDCSHKRQGRRWKSGDSVRAGAAAAPDKPKWKQPDYFRYGNYNRYYGYRNPNQEPDYRLSCMRRDWLEGKDVLDLGCNVGHVTLSLARDFGPRRIVGTDIDQALIDVARKNVSHYLTRDSDFPISLPIMFGPIPTAPFLFRDDPQPTFPNNVFFLQGNYVFNSDEQLDSVTPEYDTILCLSMTKWIHFNWGDEGLKRFFKRIFRNLRPGGRLILEPQNWRSYSKKKKLVPSFFEHYQSIRLKPENFTEYLLSKDVGFSTCEVIDTPFNHARGFQRPMQLFTKSETSPSSTPSEALRISQNNSPGKETPSRA